MLKRKKGSPEAFYYFLILLVGLSLLTIHITSQIWDHYSHVDDEYQEFIAKAKKDAQYVKISMENLIAVAGSGAVHLDEYVKALNQQEFMLVRTVHSASLNAQYDFDKKEQPEHELEVKALQDGKQYSWETEDFFVNALPMVASKPCQVCPATVEDLTKPVPIGYTIAVIEVKVPTAQFQETKKVLKEKLILSIIAESFLILLLGYGIFHASISLRRMARRNRLILEKTLEGFLMLGQKGNVLNCNDAVASMLGYSKEELIGTDIHTICGKRENDDVKIPLLEEEVGDLLREVNVYKTKDGRILDVESSVSIIKAGKEQIIYSFVRDITERKRAREELLRTQEKLKETNKELIDLNQHLEVRVDQKTKELGKVNVLKQFFSPQLVESFSSDQPDKIMKSHRRVVTVVFLDLRGFTDFVNKNSADEVMTVLREYHQGIGPVVFDYEATLERFTGDGIMVFLGDPIPREDHAGQAVRMSIKLRSVVNELRK